jgi:flagellar assembly protein FliH
VEKKSSHNSSPDPKPYKPVQFDESLTPVNAYGEETVQDRLKALESEGYQKGHSSGYDKGIKDGQSEIEVRLKRLDEIIKELDNFKRRNIAELTPLITELSLLIAKKIIHKEIELHKDVVLAIARDAVKKVEETTEEVIIKVNPADYEVMLTNLALLKEQSGVKNMTIEPSASIAQGGCYIETKTIEIDARIEEQIKEIEDAVGTATNREV